VSDERKKNTNSRERKTQQAMAGALLLLCRVRQQELGKARAEQRQHWWQCVTKLSLLLADAAVAQQYRGQEWLEDGEAIDQIWAGFLSPLQNLAWEIFGEPSWGCCGAPTGPDQWENFRRVLTVASTHPDFLTKERRELLAKAQAAFIGKVLEEIARPGGGPLEMRLPRLRRIAQLVTSSPMAMKSLTSAKTLQQLFVNDESPTRHQQHLILRLFDEIADLNTGRRDEPYRMLLLPLIEDLRSQCRHQSQLGIVAAHLQRLSERMLVK
jgi:hypothetical protein